MIESDDDLLLFLETDDFALAVAVTVQGQEPVTIKGIFDRRPPMSSATYRGFNANTDFGRDLGQASGSSPRLLCRTSDVTGVKPGRATAVVQGITYNVFDVQPDGTGLSILSLKRD